MFGDANTIITIPTPWLSRGSWLEKLYEELLHTGVLADVEKVTNVSVDEDLIYHVIMWRCTEYGENRCPAVVVTLDGQVVLLKISTFADRRYVELYDFKEILTEEIRGLQRHADCDLAGYVC
jgi:hypothetical protein